MRWRQEGKGGMKWGCEGSTHTLGYRVVPLPQKEELGESISGKLGCCLGLAGHQGHAVLRTGGTIRVLSREPARFSS